ncbi:hypothetical protein C8R47DRAFT_1224720 [Mycena vitilis]|nr:hypothetical protein C8R47DRAFT_1224720 [Mycena vitilis]
MNRLAAELRTKTRYDINAVDRNAPRMAYAYTADELEAHAQHCGGVPVGTLCLSCDLPIPRWGCGEYVLDQGVLSAVSATCKACWQYCPSNSRLDAFEVIPKPNCTCPPGSLACAAVPTGCELHKVPAIRPAPRGEVRLLRPKNRQELNTELEELEAKLCREAHAVMALHGFTAPAYTEACIRWVDALAAAVELSRSRVADFRMPPPPPSPPIALRPPYVRPARVFAPKIPVGYDFAAAARQRAQRANVGADRGGH